MKSKWRLIAAIIQVLIGTLAVAAFIVLAACGEDVKRWLVTLVLAVAFIVIGVIGINDYKSK